MRNLFIRFELKIYKHCKTLRNYLNNTSRGQQLVIDVFILNNRNTLMHTVIMVNDRICI